MTNASLSHSQKSLAESEAADLAAFSAALADELQKRLASGEWRVVGLSGTDHLPDIAQALKDVFGSDINHPIIAVIESTKAEGT